MTAAQIPLTVGFTAHANFFRYSEEDVPFEIATVFIPTGEKYIYTIDQTKYIAYDDDRMHNEHVAYKKNFVKFHFPKGEYSLKFIESDILERYMALDGYRFLSVAVNGSVQKNYFSKLGLPALDMDKDLGFKLPNSSMSTPVSDMEWHRKDIHSSGNDSKCSLRLPQHYRNFIFEHHKLLLREILSIANDSLLQVGTSSRVLLLRANVCCGES